MKCILGFLCNYFVKVYNNLHFNELCKLFLRKIIKSHIK